MALALHADVLIAGYESGHVAIFQLQDNGSTNIVYLCKAHSQPVLSLAVHADDATVITSGADSKIVKHPLDRPPTLYPSSPKSPGHSISENEKHSAISPSIPISSHDIKHTGISSLNLRDDGEIFAVACWDGNVRVFRYFSMKLLASFPGGRQDGVSCLEFGRTIIDSDENTQETSPERQHKEVQSFVIGKALRHKAEQKAKSRHWLAVGGKDGRIGLWDIY